MKRIKNPNDIPTGPHFAVLVYATTSIHHEGDERSRTNPGHGYPAYTETVDAFEHYVTTSASELEVFVTQLEQPNTYGQKKPYAVIDVGRRLETKTTTRVEIC